MKVFDDNGKSMDKKTKEPKKIESLNGFYLRSVLEVIQVIIFLVHSPVLGKKVQRIK